MNTELLNDALELAVAAAKQVQEFKAETYSAVLLASLLAGAPSASRKSPGSATAVSGSATTKPYSPAEFFSLRVLGSEIDKVVVAAAFLEAHQGLTSYTIEEIRNCLVSAKISIPTNLSLAIFQSVKKGWLMDVRNDSGAKKAWALTQTGERKSEEMMAKES